MIEASGSLPGVLRPSASSGDPGRPRRAARAVIVLVHGLGEHSGRYDHVVARLVREGYAVHAIDHRGHGRSDGPRAFIEDMDNAVADVDALVDRAVEAHPGVPVFMLGHSMGGLIALRYAIAHQDRLAGLILSAALAALEAVPKPLRAGRAGAVGDRAPRAADRHRPVPGQPRPRGGQDYRVRSARSPRQAARPHRGRSSPTRSTPSRRRSAPSPCRRSSSTAPPTDCALRRAARCWASGSARPTRP